MSSLEYLKSKMISSAKLQQNGNYTKPRSYGVYRLDSRGNTGQRYRFGNHPVRMFELEREFGNCDLEGLFLDREDAKEFARILNR